MPKLADWIRCLVAMMSWTAAVGWSAEPSTGVPVRATPAVAFRQTGNRPDVGPGGPYKIVAADFTGDGRVDIAIGYHAIGLVTIEEGDGQGMFRRVGQIEASVIPPSETGGTYNVAAGNVDDDGLPDLVFSVHGSPPGDWKDKDLPADILQSGWAGMVAVARNQGEGRFETIAEFPTRSHATGVALADLDRDGRCDLLYAARGTGYRGDVKTGTLFIRRGIDGASFADAVEFPAGPSAYAIVTGDLNGDGFLDLIVPNEHGTTVQTWLNPGHDIFQGPQAWARSPVEATAIPGKRSQAINHVQAADFNQDGKLDLLTANLGTSTVSLFAGNGDGTFQKDQLLDGGRDGAWLAVGDLNRDRAPDFVIAHWTGDFISVFLNDGHGRFGPSKDYTTGLGSYGVTVVDVDGDGNLDALSANYRERTLSFLRGVGDGTFQPAATTNKGLKRVSGVWTPE